MSPVIIMLAVLLLMNTSWPVAVLLIVGVALFFAVNLITRQESMLYVPCVMPGMQRPGDNPEGLRSPADKGLEFEDVYLTTVDGVRVHGWFMPAKKEVRGSAPTVLFCHANAGNIGLRVPNFREMIDRLEVNVFALDYRGYGNSEGTPSEDGLIEDAVAAWQWLRAAADEGRLDGRRIFIFGRSLGGAVAIALARALQQRTETAPCGVVLENTFASISQLVDTLFPIIAFKFLKDRFLRLRWESFERIKELEVPLLFLTGQQDEMIPPSHSQALHANAKKSPLRRSEVFPDGSHNDTWEKGGDRYWEVWHSFFEECSSAKHKDVTAAS